MQCAPSNLHDYLVGSFVSHTVEHTSLFYTWLTCKIVSTFYTIFWDLKMDFGFFAANDGGHKWLREELVYPSTNIYYVIMIQDVVLRFSWVAGLALSKV